MNGTICGLVKLEEKTLYNGYLSYSYGMVGEWREKGNLKAEFSSLREFGLHTARIMK